MVKQWLSAQWPNRALRAVSDGNSSMASYSWVRGKQSRAAPQGWRLRKTGLRAAEGAGLLQREGRRWQTRSPALCRLGRGSVARETAGCSKSANCLSLGFRAARATILARGLRMRRDRPGGHDDIAQVRRAPRHQFGLCCGGFEARRGARSRSPGVHGSRGQVVIGLGRLG